ncbi:hypothetical protein WT24_02595 [Burkholderia sp. MSMB1078WGS]|nr:hypothetical protein WS61_05430 [Burkholderia sp. ABCPW 11]KVT03840.1 hypothetical protein WT24_02595 [Burkholderia sp. MSMB1078WGS]
MARPSDVVALHPICTGQRGNAQQFGTFYTLHHNLRCMTSRASYQFFKLIDTYLIGAIFR